jgi:hypothetical protein
VLWIPAERANEDDGRRSKKMVSFFETQVTSRLVCEVVIGFD